MAAQVALVRQAAAEALGLDNRGPLLLTAEGHLHPTIVEFLTNHFVFSAAVSADDV